MKTSKKVSIIIASASIVAGIGILFAAALKAEFNIEKFNTVDLTYTTYTVDDQFEKISADIADCDFRIEASIDESCSIACKENEHTKDEIFVENGTLMIKRRDNSRWYDHLGFFWNSNEITLYLPKTKYKELQIKSSSGDIIVPQEFSFDSAQVQCSSGCVDFNACVSEKAMVGTSSGDVYIRNASPKLFDISSTSGDIEIISLNSKSDMTVNSTSGDINITDVECKSLNSNSTSGEVEITGLKSENLSIRTTSGDVDIIHADIADKLHINCTSGDADISESDAGTLYIKSTSGDVSGSFLSEKVFITDTKSGDVDVPHSASGGKCEIYTTSGDISFYVLK